MGQNRSSSIRILVVDDDFATLEFLRSILALAQDDFEVVGVPSAEEALLELRRSPFRLLIADVRLPGMSGLELIRSTWEFCPDLPVIMITAYTLSEVGQELRALGITSIFRKPLDAEDFLEAVFSAVLTAEPVVARAADEQPIQQKLKSPTAVAERLDLLRTDTGARQVIMATTAGELLYVSGRRPEFDLRLVVEAMAQSVTTSFRLANWLNQAKPSIIQFLSGPTSDIYFTNIDHEYFAAIFIDTQTRRGRIGTIWVFTQRAVSDIRRLLIDQEVTTTNEPEQAVDHELSGPSTEDRPLRPQPEYDMEPANEVAPILNAKESNLSPAASANEHISEPLEEMPASVSLADDQIETILTQLQRDKTPNDLQDTNVEAFWDEALSTDLGNSAQGLSLDEAREQGLIGPYFEFDDD